MLRDIVIPPSLLTKLLSVAGANFNTSPGATGPFSSPIPWRKAGLRYNKNEIYFDIVEDLKAVVDKYVVSIILETASSNIHQQKRRNSLKPRMGQDGGQFKTIRQGAALHTT
jgi:hypothetical protein